MIGKSTGARIVLLVIALILLVLLWGYGVSSEIMIGAIILVVIRIIALLAKLTPKSGDNNSNSEE